ncbi:MAG TPA: hypothetical protein PKE45_16235, partial [Caldilineaceae bacterium]|nr:hypothetical protein [Caldilineaceae bacterium]
GGPRGGGGGGGGGPPLGAAGPRYEQAIRSAKLGFQPPAALAEFAVRERAPGNATTDFGAPDAALAIDAEPINETTLHRLQAILAACWQTLGETVQATGDRPLRKGPRGGGRDLEQIVHHVVDAHESYLRKLGWQPEWTKSDDWQQTLAQVKAQTNEALAAAATGKTPRQGPRGGVYWQPARFARRAAWHLLDHVWEIEDRVESS